MSKNDFIRDLRSLISKYSEKLQIGFVNKAEGSRIVVRLEVQELNEKGEIRVSDFENTLCDRYCKRNGIDFDYDHEHIIKSKWANGSNVIQVVGFKRRNRKYPILIQYEESKKTYKISATYLKSCRLIGGVDSLKLDDFRVWLTTDPEEDCINRKDEETYDKVESLLSSKYTASDWASIDEQHKNLLHLYRKRKPSPSFVDSLYEGFIKGEPATSILDLIIGELWILRHL